jgi:hypothetical protein
MMIVRAAHETTMERRLSMVDFMPVSKWMSTVVPVNGPHTESDSPVEVAAMKTLAAMSMTTTRTASVLVTTKSHIHVTMDRTVAMSAIVHLKRLTDIRLSATTTLTAVTDMRTLTDTQGSTTTADMKTPTDIYTTRMVPTTTMAATTGPAVINTSETTRSGISKVPLARTRLQSRKKKTNLGLEMSCLENIPGTTSLALCVCLATTARARTL